MACLLAKLGSLTDTNHRVVCARREESVQEVRDEAQVAPAGALVLLLGRGPPWAKATPVHASPWPDSLGTHEQLRENRHPRLRHIENLQRLISSSGTYTTDDRGVPCEIGRCFNRDAEFHYFINYAGWRLVDLPDSLRVIVTTAQDNSRVCIIPPGSVDAPRDDGNRGQRLDTWGEAVQPSRRLAPVAGYVVAPPALPPQSPTPFRLHLRWQDLKFADGAVSFRVDGHAGIVATPLSRAIYQSVSAELDQDLPEGAAVEGVRHANGSIEAATISGLDRFFALADYRRFVRGAMREQTWQVADDLASRCPVKGGTQPEVADLLEIPEFFGKRREAFRRLFAHRARAEHVRMLPGRGLIVPLEAQDNGAPWYAWETVSDGHATYLFRPATPEQRDQMFVWTQGPNPRRVDLLADPSLQAELGYDRRIMHRDDDDDELGRWWDQLRDVVGIVVSARSEDKRASDA